MRWEVSSGGGFSVFMKDFRIRGGLEWPWESNRFATKRVGLGRAVWHWASLSMRFWRPTGSKTWQFLSTLVSLLCIVLLLIPTSASSLSVSRVQMTFSTQVPNTQNKFALNVLSYNLYGVFGWFSPARRRTARLIESGILDAYDVLVFQELFNAGHREGLVKALKERQHPYCTDVLNGRGHGRWGNGGVIVCSRYPFVQPAQEITYRVSRGWDRLVAKGAMYVAVKKEGRVYHLMATHTQADESTLHTEQRSDQVRQLSDWIRQTKIPVNEPLLVVGDLNVPKYRGQGKEYQSMLDTLQVTDLKELPRDGLELDTPTYDPVNNRLASGDKAWVLDYVLASTAHRQPVSSFKRVLPLPFSDHYAVHGYVSYE